MKTNQNFLQKNTRFIFLLCGVIGILSIPLIAMQFTNQVDWKFSDFLIIGILLSGTAIVCEFILRNVRTIKYRILLCAVALFILFLIWVELAVGIFGTPFAGS